MKTNFVLQVKVEGTGVIVIARPFETAGFPSYAISPSEPETVFFGHHDGQLVSYHGGEG